MDRTIKKTEEIEMKSSKVPAGYWRCSQCGQLNENEYELCMACGMVKDINAALPKELEGRKRAAEPEAKPPKKSPKPTTWA